MTPASCLKVITTAAAMHVLGEEFCYETSLEFDGDCKEGVLTGNIYIKGGGDPCLGSSRIQGSLDWKAQMQSFVDAIVAQGVVQIEGTVVGDASLWEKAGVIPSWSWEDMGNYYGAGASALSFHENAYSLFLQPGIAIGDKVAILRTEPPQKHLIFESELKTAEAGSGDQACIYGSEFSFCKWLRGTIPAGVPEFSIKGAIPDPASYCAELLTEQLLERGIAVLGKKIPSQKRRVLYRVSSPNLAKIVYHTNQKSINLFAEHLLKKMGEVVTKEGSTEAGLLVVEQFCREIGMDMEGFHMVDGSGLSRKNLVTAKQFVQLLCSVKKSPIFPSFFQSLPEKEKGIRGKTGGMSLVRGYVGYSDDIAFAILINHCSSFEAMHKKIESVLEKINEANRVKNPLLNSCETSTQ
jgi:D-alanyl-D-alanine carboxypeptidase/D-alanyl-D-alanine-endopeptidase (penicillin-binding protein 4)